MKFLWITILFNASCFALHAQEIYHQDFEKNTSWNDFHFTNAAQWQIVKEADGNFSLAITAPNNYDPPYRSPRSIALLNQYWLNDFVLEVDLKQNGVPHDCQGETCIMCQHRDMCIFWNIQDSSHFYYAHIAAHTDDVSHQIHIVNNAARAPVTSYRNSGIDWGDDEWQHIKVVHSASRGETRIYFNDMEQPVLVSKDKTFSGGYIGFGSFDEMGQVDNMRLISKDYQFKAASLFENE